MRARGIIAAAALAVAAISATARAGAPPEPSGPHPRIWLDASTLAHMRRQLGDSKSGAARAVEACTEARAKPRDHREAGYRGARFAALVTSCALAYQLTGDRAHAEVGLRYLEALLDDEREVGDGGARERGVRGDGGYAIRFRGPAAALGYDWLHGAPGAGPILARARARFRAWTDWYRRDGYLRDRPGANYHAGWFFAAALIAVAEGGEAKEAGTELWRYVTGEMVPQLSRAMAAGGVLDGGDWPEGWQYGPLAVLEYSLGSRALAEQGVKVSGLARWTESLVRRHVYALTPTRRASFIGGDTDLAAPFRPPSRLPLLAVIAGDASPRARAYARAELASLERREDEPFPVYDALAQARPGPAIPFPRSPGQTAYRTRGTGRLYARSSWNKDAIWMVTSCSAPPVPDHYHLDAGNFVLTRGDDPLIIDPSPYGSLSTLTSNAPTVDSAQLPDEYRPSQAPWGRATRFSFAGQSASGVVVARCEYADQYRFKRKESDIARAERDLVLIPRSGAAALVVWDRAAIGKESGLLDLRFRTPGALRERGGVARARIGDSQISIRRVSAGRPRSEVRPLSRRGNCWDGPRGRCRLSRLGGRELTVQARGPSPETIYLLDATGAGATPPAPRRLDGPGYRGLSASISGRRFAVILDQLSSFHSALAWAPLVYVGPADAVHVILDARTAAKVTARPAPGGCAVAVSAAAGAPRVAGLALVLQLSKSCRPSIEHFGGAGDERRARESPRATRPRRGSARRSANRTGCAACGGGRAGGSGAAFLFVAGLISCGRRRRRPFS